MIQIIVNPTAGGGSAVDNASTLARACADAGMSVHVHVAANRDDSVRTAMETASRGLVVACGGDGTVNLVADQAIIHNGIISILPFGRGNDFAKFIGIANATMFPNNDPPEIESPTIIIIPLIARRIDIKPIKETFSFR